LRNLLLHSRDLFFTFSLGRLSFSSAGVDSDGGYSGGVQRRMISGSGSGGNGSAMVVEFRRLSGDGFPLFYFDFVFSCCLFMIVCYVDL
jgi:hypothetical protein